jgi:iduronate 2-sulfatase
VDYFTQNGYYTRTLGKIHHGPSDYNTSEKHYKYTTTYYSDPKNISFIKGKDKKEFTNQIQPWEHADLPDDQYPDGQICDETIETIRRAVKQDKPFFIAPGFKKPHLSFVCPKKYYDLYKTEDVQLAFNPQLGPSQATYSVNNDGVYKWWNYKKQGIDDKNARQLKHSYMACISFIDAQVGMIMKELDDLGIADNTAIMFWSDHGFHLGEYTNWGKGTNYEWATRSPLIISTPGMKEAGKKTNALVEYVDMYPTLCDIAGIAIPKWLEGTSMRPLFNDSDQKWKRAAFSQFPRGTYIEGFSVRTQDYRYTEWREYKTGKVKSRELYDNRKGLNEVKNQIDNPEYSQERRELTQVLKEGWRQSLPPGITNEFSHSKGDDSYYEKIKKDKPKKLKKKKK